MFSSVIADAAYQFRVSLPDVDSVLCSRVRLISGALHCQTVPQFFHLDFFFFFDLHGRLDGEAQRVDELRSDSQVLP